METIDIFGIISLCLILVHCRIYSHNQPVRLLLSSGDFSQRSNGPNISPFSEGSLVKPINCFLWRDGIGQSDNQIIGESDPTDPFQTHREKSMSSGLKVPYCTGLLWAVRDKQANCCTVVHCRVCTNSPHLDLSTDKLLLSSGNFSQSHNWVVPRDQISLPYPRVL